MSLHHIGAFTFLILLYGNAIAAPVVSGEIITAGSSGVVYQALTGGGKITQAAGCPPGNEQIPDSLVQSDTP
ncbi:MAG: hypothetical protein GXY45_10830 [Ramlibacter sp.]|nr:hypothetical protein [Ramlibacter sp.]